jgi:hypothetical protein
MTATEVYQELQDPLKLAKVCWPDTTFYDKQRDVIYSFAENRETVCYAGNMLGKDFVAAFLVLWFFLTRHPCRVVTTSVDAYQLESVLWGELRNFIQSSRIPLSSEKGGPILVNHLHLRKIVAGEMDSRSYVLGRVAAKGEGMLGHHIAETGDGVPRTAFVSDEASGVDDLTYTRASTWAKRRLIIGNPFPCNNYFRRAIKEGDSKTRKVIQIKAVDSPNVKLAMREKALKRSPSNVMVVPGVLSYMDYVERRDTWDKIMQSIGLDAEFYEGGEILMYPPDWLNRAEEIARRLEGSRRQAKAIGIDPAQGGDKTAMAAVDEYGLIELVSRRTPDTSVIPGEVIAFGNRHQVPPEMWIFDNGGGGKQHADILRNQGLPVQIIAFGEVIALDLRTGMRMIQERREVHETRIAYKNRRAQMYGDLRGLLNPAGEGFGIPAEYTELRRQLAPIPMWYDGEGRLFLPSKYKRDSSDTKPTLTEIIGCSPDEADALVLAVHGMLHKESIPEAAAY